MLADERAEYFHRQHGTGDYCSPIVHQVGRGKAVQIFGIEKR